MRRSISLDPSIDAYSYSPDCKWVLGERLSDGAVVVRRVRGPPEKDIVVAIHKYCFLANHDRRYFIGNPSSGYDVRFCEDHAFHIDLPSGRVTVYKTDQGSEEDSLWMSKNTYIKARTYCLYELGGTEVTYHSTLPFSRENGKITISSSGKYCYIRGRNYGEVWKFNTLSQKYAIHYPINVTGPICSVTDGGYVVCKKRKPKGPTRFYGIEVHSAKGVIYEDSDTTSFSRDIDRSNCMIIVDSGDRTSVWDLSGDTGKKYVCNLRRGIDSNIKLADDGASLIFTSDRGACVMFIGRWNPAVYATNPVCIAAVGCRRAVREAVRVSPGSVCEAICEAVFEANMADDQ